MDPYSAEGELINIHNHFHQGQYQEVVDFDTSAFSSDNALPARVLQLRARIALGEAAAVAAEVKGESGTPELAAVGALAQLAQGQADAAVAAAEALASSAGDNAVVQVLGGTVLQAAGKSEEALALLSQHSGNRGWPPPSSSTAATTTTTTSYSHDCGLADTDRVANVIVCLLVEAVALITQIHLEQNRTDLALKEVKAARSWAQDSLLVNLAESWVGVRVVCRVGGLYHCDFGANNTNRAAKDTSRHSTFSRSWHRPRRHHPMFRLSRKPCASFTWDVLRRRRELSSRPWRRTPSVQRRSPTFWC
jgi:hypothetical protein